MAVFATQCQRNFFPPNFPTVISSGGTAVFAVPEWRNPSSGFLIQVFNLDVIGDCEACLQALAAEGFGSQSNFGTEIPLFPVRNPNILHLHRVLQEPTALALLAIEPINRAPFVRKNLLQVPDRQGLRRCATRLITKAPDRI